MLTVGFLVPLGISVKSQAKLRGVATAQSDARGVATAVAAVTPHFSSSFLERSAASTTVSFRGGIYS